MGWKTLAIEGCDLTGEGAIGRIGGVLLQAPHSRHGDKVFFCAHGRRHWVTDATWLAEHGFRWPEDVQQVSAAVLDAFLPGQNAARAWNDTDWSAPPRNSV